MLLGGVGAGRSGGATFDARTLVRAQVMAVDRETGHVAMQAAGARFEADFPASVVAEMKTGDIVLVTVKVTDTRTAAIAGPITSVDPDKGTDHGEWPLHVQCGSREAEGDEAR